MEDRRSVGASSCNSGDGTDQILDVYDDDDDDDDDDDYPWPLCYKYQGSQQMQPNTTINLFSINSRTSVGPTAIIRFARMEYEHAVYNGD